MKVFITGGTGFVGKNLSERLLKEGYRVTAVGTRPKQKEIKNGNFHYISADTTKEGTWQNELEDVDAVVNLAGRTIFHYWTKSYKQKMYDSRILTTQNIVKALPLGRNIVLCSTSAVGYYGDRGDEILTEDTSPGNDFLAGLARDWESAALSAREKDVRVIIARFGIVLGKNGGALKQMLPAFRAGLGGPLGNGKQWFPWIHMDDLVSAIILILKNNKLKGPFNFTAPQSVRQRDFAGKLGKFLNRPAFIPAPGFMIRLVMGELGQVLLTGQKARPEKLLRCGFQFQYPDIQSAFDEILKS